MNPDALSEEVLSAYVDGECTDEERVAVEARLASDAEWRTILEEVRETRAVVRALPRREPPAGFVDALVEVTEEREQLDASARSTRRHRGRRPRIIAGVAAAAAIAVGFMIATPNGRGSDVAPPIATLANSHGATMSLQSDPLSGLAPIAANFRNRTVRRWLIVAGGAIGLSLLAIGVAAGADDSGDDSEWTSVVDHAREQMQSQAFDGVVVVEWRDEDGRHRAQVPVHQQDGRVEVGTGDHTVASDASSVMLDGQAWTTLGGAHGEAAAALTRGKYHVTHQAGPMIAGNATTQYDASRDGHVVERVFVHEDTGLVLRREVVGADGDVARSVSFMRVQPSAEDTPTSSTVPAQAGPRPVDNLSRPYQDPATAGDGFRLIGRWQHSDDLAELYYSDGVLSVSVFEQPGHLDWKTLPAGGVAAEMNGRRALHYTLPVGEAWVFERGGVVYTCVGDASAEELAKLANDVSRPDENRVERLARTVVEPFSW